MHHRLSHPALRRTAAFSAICLAGGMTLSHAASPNDPDDQYRREVQTCQDGRSGQDKDNCMTEARRALAARKKGALETDTNAVVINARKRCEVFTGDDKAACLARIDGSGSTSGSVAGGGILREVETVDIAPGSASTKVEPQSAEPVIQSPSKPRSTD